MRTIVVIFLTLGALSATGDCGELTGYARGLCLYDRGELDKAAEVFVDVVERDDFDGIRSGYFLARIEMKREEWEEASKLFFELFSRSPAFYRLWNCDYLLGVCRERMGAP